MCSSKNNSCNSGNSSRQNNNGGRDVIRHSNENSGRTYSEREQRAVSNPVPGEGGKKR